eukprot:Selendium_serpulae@DN6370_c0_g1_i6.p1
MNNERTPKMGDRKPPDSVNESHLSTCASPEGNESDGIMTRMSAVEEIEYDSIAVIERPQNDAWSKKVHRFLVFVGPGFLVAMGYLDPGNVEGDMAIGGIRTGRFGGYSLLWLVMLAHICGTLFQIISARIGNVTGHDLATLCRLEYPRWTSRLLWLTMEAAIIGADFQTVVGTAVALRLLTGIPLWIGVLLTVLEAFLFLIVQMTGVRPLEAFFAVLVAILSTCFFINGVASDPSAISILKGLLIPQLPPGEFTKAIGIVGCIMMPHNIYLHSALVQSRAVNRSSAEAVKESNLFFGIETALTIFVAFLVNAAIVCTFAHPDLVAPPGDQGWTLNAGYLALQKVFGMGAGVVWAVGLFAAGQSSTLAGTYAGQFVMQGFLDLKISPFARVLVARIITLVPLVALCFVSFAEYATKWYSRCILIALTVLYGSFCASLLKVKLVTRRALCDYRDSYNSLMSEWDACSSLIRANED